jgi:spore coat-associated protein N
VFKRAISLGGKSIAAKVAMTGAIVVAATGVVGGTYATWTSSASQAQSISSGTVTIALGATGAATNRLNIAASAIAPGDTIRRSVDLTNTGTLALSAVTLTTTASPSSLLDTDATNGLQMTIQACSVAWTESGTSPAFGYTCSGTTSTPVASRAVIGSNLALGSLNALAAGGTDHLQVVLTLPTLADNTFQGKTSTITYQFTGTQRAAGAA